MYRNKRLNRNSRLPSVEAERNKRPLNTIDENTTIKLPRKEAETTALISNEPSIFSNDGLLDEPQSSEENLPASQEPSQRYFSQRFISQRSNLALSLGRTQSNSSSQNARPPSTYLELSLVKAGTDLNDDNTFVLSCDHITFVEKFRKLLKNNQNYPDNIETFKTGLISALEPKSQLAIKLLSGCTINLSGEASSYQSQDSMIVNFLMIDFLTEPVLDVLLDKIQLAASDSNYVGQQYPVPLLPLMLAQLRYAVTSYGGKIYERLEQIFEKANNAGKREIITNAGLMMDVTRHDEFAQFLLDNVENNADFFNATTMNSLTDLMLSVEMQGKLRYKMLAYIENSQCPNELLPTLFRFLMKILSEDKDVHIKEVVDNLRKILLHDNYQNIKKNIQMEIFGYIEQGLIRSQKFYSTWQKSIASLPETQFRSIDFVVLLMLVHIKEENCMHVENILRRRIKNESLSLDVLKDTREKFPIALEKYIVILMNILHSFLKEKHVAMINFSRSSYEIMFQICAFVQKSILKKLLALACDKSAQNMTNTALELLKSLHKNHTREIQNWGMLLLPLLDRLNEMTFSQTRLIMELLCSIAYPPPTFDDCPALQDQINMLVKKQIINRNAIIKKQGIIGSAQLINCVARIDDIGCSIENLSMSLIDMPDGRGKIAAKLFERVQTATTYCPESVALFYDELASICINSLNDKQRGFLNKSFLMWLNETITSQFESSFTVEDACLSLCGVPLRGMKCINVPEDVSAECSESSLLIAVNIAELVLKPSNEASSSILLLAPTFSLLRELQIQRNENSLESINALLGCAIILPTFFEQPDYAEHIRNDFDEATQMKILDIYFHCVNWLREVVSSFITQRDASTKRKVLQRLTDIIQIETKVRNLLLWISPDYIPPKVQFITDGPRAVNKIIRAKPAQSKNPSKAKTKSTELPPESDMTALNETELNNTTNMDNTVKMSKVNKQKAGNLNFENMYGPKEVYRQMSSNVMLFLYEELNMEMPLPATEIGYKIGLPEYYFVLTDLVSKLESVTGVQKLEFEGNFQYIAQPHYFISDLSTFLMHIGGNMKKLSDAINKQLTILNHVYSDTELFKTEFCYLRACFDLGVRLFAAYFSWEKFSNSSNNELLKQSLKNIRKSFGETPSTEEEEISLNELISNVFTAFLDCQTAILHLKTSVHLYNLLITLRKLCALNGSPSDIITKQANSIRSLSKNFLQRKWYDYNGCQEKGTNCNLALDILVKGFLKNSDFKRLSDVATLVFKEAKTLKGKEYFMKSFPNITKANFPILYRALCEAFINGVNDAILTQTSSNNMDKLRSWEKSCELLNFLQEFPHSLDMPRNFQVFIKYSHIYVKLVLQYALPDMEECLRRNVERVSSFLKALQVSTRFLHQICCQSKVQKNTAIVSQIPLLRKTMEALVFRVKALLAANKCSSVFTIGVLKNKDTHGNELVLSQTASSCAEEDSEEELPEDDVTVCESLLESEEGTRNVYAQVKDENGTASKTSSRSNCF